MAKKKSSKEFSYDIKEVIGILDNNAESKWRKYLSFISWNDAPPKIDIRNMNLEDERMSSGITLNDNEADILTDLLISRGYGSIELLRETISQKENIMKSLQSLDEEKKDYIYEITIGE
ncbi:MAG: hypothetical protein PHF63_00755 [Herbinix sp.]|nr:hypothetical protein [Herbinix sp.]